MNLGDFRLELNGDEEAVEAADDKPVMSLLPEHYGACRAGPSTVSGNFCSIGFILSISLLSTKEVSGYITPTPPIEACMSQGI